MVSFLHDILPIEFFLILFMLMIDSVAFQAFIHKRDLNQEDLKSLFRSLTNWVIGLALLMAGLIVIALLAK